MQAGRKEKIAPQEGAAASPAGAPAERRDARLEASAFLDSVQASAAEHAGAASGSMPGSHWVTGAS